MNDQTLGIARAQRDLGCRYTLGFYVKNPVEDKEHRVKIRVPRPGLRAIHPSNYAFRSPDAKSESLLRAAFVAPEMFQTGVARAHVFPLKPGSARDWNALLTISFPVALDPDTAPEEVRDFGAVLQSGSRVVHRFDRRITLRPFSTASPSDRRITFLEPVTLKPGNYKLTLVLSDPTGDRPHTAVVNVELPALPKRELFLVGPILGREAAEDVVIRGHGAASKRDRKSGRSDPTSAADRVGSARSFEPLLVQEVNREESIFAMTQACMVGSRKSGADTKVRRSLHAEGAGEVGLLPPVELELSGRGKIRCQNLLDVLPANAMDPGKYIFEARLEPSGPSRGEEQGIVRFAVTDPPPANVNP